MGGNGGKRCLKKSTGSGPECRGRWGEEAARAGRENVVTKGWCRSGEELAEWMAALAWEGR
jgi:hypothetical protein